MLSIAQCPSPTPVLYHDITTFCYKHCVRNTWKHLTNGSIWSDRCLEASKNPRKETKRIKWMERTKNMKKKKRVEKPLSLASKMEKRWLGGGGEGKINKRENGWPSVHLSFHSVLSWIFPQKNFCLPDQVVLMVCCGDSQNCAGEHGFYNHTFNFKNCWQIQSCHYQYGISACLATVTVWLWMWNGKLFPVKIIEGKTVLG